MLIFLERVETTYLQYIFFPCFPCLSSTLRRHLPDFGPLQNILPMVVQVELQSNELLQVNNMVCFIISSYRNALNINI